MGKIVENFARPGAQLESKTKVHWLDKMRDPVTVRLKRNLRDELAGKNMVLVDDILTTGESLIALRAALEEQGFKQFTEAVLAAKKGGHVASPPNYESLAAELEKAAGVARSEILRDLQLAFPRVYANFLLSALRDARDHPAAVYNVIRRQADLVRGSAGAH